MCACPAAYTDLDPPIEVVKYAKTELKPGMLHTSVKETCSALSVYKNAYPTGGYDTSATMLA